MIHRKLGIVLAFLTTTTYAQVKFGPEVGINMAMMNKHTKFAGYSTTDGSQLSPGFKGGVIADFKTIENLYLQSGAFYVSNRVKFSENIDFSEFNLNDAKTSRLIATHNIQVPLYVMYKSGFEGMGRFFIGAGPYVGYAVAGAEKLRNPVLQYDSLNRPVAYRMRTTNSDLQLGTDSAASFRNWDYGINATMGYESNVGLYFRGTVNYGLANMVNHSRSQNRYNNWGFGISIGVLLGKDGW